MDFSQESTTTDREISESDIPRLLIELSEEGLLYLKNDQTEESLKLLMKCKEIIQTVSSQGVAIDTYLIIVILYNIALSYQRQGNLEESYVNLEDCLNLLKTQKIPTLMNSKKIAFQIGERIRNEILLSKLHLNSCAVLSQINKHDAALFHAKQACKVTHNVVDSLYKSSSDYLLKLNKKQNASKIRFNFSSRHPTKIEANDKLLPDGFEKNYDIIRYLFMKINGMNDKSLENVKPRKLQLRSSLGVEKFND